VVIIFPSSTQLIKKSTRGIVALKQTCQIKFDNMFNPVSPGELAIQNLYEYWYIKGSNYTVNITAGSIQN
jgi:hypothetical protein